MSLQQTDHKDKLETKNFDQISTLDSNQHNLNTKTLAQSIILLTSSLIAIEIPPLINLTHESDQYQVLAIGWMGWHTFIKRSHTVRRPFWTEMLDIVIGAFFLSALENSLHATHSGDFSFKSSILLFISLLILLPTASLIGRITLNALGLWKRPTLIFGVGKNAIEAHKALSKEPWMGMNVVGFVSVFDKEPPPNPSKDIPTFKWIDTEHNWNKLHQNFHCVIALEADERKERDQLILKLMENKINNVTIVPAMRGVPLYGAEITHFLSSELLYLTLSNNLSKIHLRFIKRLFDIAGASLLIVATAPLMILIALRIRHESPGAVIFSQPRVGRNGNIFRFYKFRSMIHDAEQVLQKWKEENSPEWQDYVANNFKLANDSRVLKIGKTIRATSIDELPQLFNVLRGEMSLVGPRPLLEREVNDYGETIKLYHSVRPGLTGIWQVSGRSNTSFAERETFDVWYIKNWSLWTDITILFKTIRVVLQRNGAY